MLRNIFKNSQKQPYMPVPAAVSRWSSRVQEIRDMRIGELYPYLQQNPQLVKDVEEEGFSLLILAAEQTSDALFDFVLLNGANVDFQDFDGRTALMQEAFDANPERVKKLLRAGANPNLQDIDGFTALSRVLTTDGDGEDVRDVAKALIYRGADLTLGVNVGLTPLDFADMHERYYEKDLMVRVLNRQEEKRLALEAGAAQADVSLIHQGTDVEVRAGKILLQKPRNP